MCRRTEDRSWTYGRAPTPVGFFKVPIQTPTRDHPFYDYSYKPPHFSRLLWCAWGYGGHILVLKPSHWALILKAISCNCFAWFKFAMHGVSVFFFSKLVLFIYRWNTVTPHHFRNDLNLQDINCTFGGNSECTPQYMHWHQRHIDHAFLAFTAYHTW